MSLRIAERSIEEIKDRSDIIEIISDYIPLKRSGTNYKGLCPFHNEKTPSFMVSQVKQIFHCFGCGEGGDVFKFIMKYENVSFIESVKILADRLGISLKEKEAGNQVLDKKEVLYDINHTLADFFHKTLFNEEGEKAYNYLVQRKISKSIIDKFCIGYVPLNLNELLDFCKKKGIMLSFLEELGIINRSQTGKENLYCRFRGRIVFPILDYNGKTAGFGGRIITESNMPKYINSPESLIYNKSSILFGLNFAKNIARQSNYIILVEGYLDTIGAHQAGIENVVASLGTALTFLQAKLIKRVTDTVVITYDPDIAGIKAADRGMDILLENGLQVKIGLLPKGMDPDNFIINKGKEAFLLKIQEAKDLFTFKLFLTESKYNKNTIEGKIKITEELIPTINKSAGTIQKHLYIKQLAEYIGIEENIIKAEIDKKRPDKSQNRELKKGANEKIKIIEKDISYPHEKLLLHIALKNPDTITRILSQIDALEITDEGIRNIFTFLKTNPETDIKNIIYHLEDDKISRLISELILQPDNFGDKTDQIIDDCIKKVRYIKNKQKIKTLLMDLKNAEKERKEERKTQILHEINVLKSGVNTEFK
ncbi:MAG: DNA primase [Candidatus Firestonebacteria bacterium]|nr:DNA primase [Candidatus Firestonebacteria bacterium]